MQWLKADNGSTAPLPRCFSHSTPFLGVGFNLHQLARVDVCASSHCITLHVRYRITTYLISPRNTTKTDNPSDPRKEKSAGAEQPFSPTSLGKEYIPRVSMNTSTYRASYRYYRTQLLHHSGRGPEGIVNRAHHPGHPIS